MFVPSKDRSDNFAFLNQWVEPHFEYERHHQLTVTSNADPIKCVDYLCGQILEENGNISAHTRRILALVQIQSDPRFLLAALVDLLNVLVNKGTPLKKRLITRCRKAISTEDYRYLVTHLQNGILPDSSLYIKVKDRLLCQSKPNDSKHSKGCTLQIPNKPRSPSAMKLIEDYIENSQTEAAIELLEDTIVGAPFRLTEIELLMQLYKSTNSQKSFDRFYTRLTQSLDEKEKLPSLLQETYHHFHQKAPSE